jgi:hypothetical protein
VKWDGYRWQSISSRRESGSSPGAATTERIVSRQSPRPPASVVRELPYCPRRAWQPSPRRTQRSKSARSELVSRRRTPSISAHSRQVQDQEPAVPLKGKNRCSPSRPWSPRSSFAAGLREPARRILPGYSRG